MSRVETIILTIVVTFDIAFIVTIITNLFGGRSRRIVWGWSYTPFETKDSKEGFYSYSTITFEIISNDSMIDSFVCSYSWRYTLYGKILRTKYDLIVEIGNFGQKCEENCGKVWMRPQWDQSGREIKEDISTYMCNIWCLSFYCHHFYFIHRRLYLFYDQKPEMEEVTVKLFTFQPDSESLTRKNLYIDILFSSSLNRPFFTIFGASHYCHLHITNLLQRISSIFQSCCFYASVGQ